MIFVGDATMSPYEIVYPGGSVEHWNEEPGALWMQRMLQTWGSAIWLNPEDTRRWDLTQSIGLTRELLDDRMFPLTPAGISDGLAALR